MLLIELACAVILGVYVAAHRSEEGFARDAVTLSLAALVAEDSMIRAYGFYAYAPSWHLRVDHVPLLIPAIWAPVVLSSQAVARALLGRDATPAREAVAVAALVTVDASLIEPIAVRAELWRWSEPGVFHVPVIGIVGWGLFAGAATYALRVARGVSRVGALAAAVAATHAALLALWWGALRWVLRAELSWGACCAVMAAITAGYTAALWRRGAALPWRELGPRAAATGFFAALLASRIDVSLGAWAALFTPPWLLLCARALRRRPLSPSSV